MVNPASQQASEGASLRILDIIKDFPSADDPQTRTLALDRISLSLAAGEFVALVGPSGCGKSTLLRLVAGLDLPASGELWVGNERISGPNAERGLVFQDPNLFPWLTVRRNIESGLVARGLLHSKRDEVDEFMRLVGLQHFANSFPHHLSGGMAQRAALARALINHPKIVLLDEPLGALDAFTRMRMQDEVLRLWEARNTTVLLVTHDIDEAIYMSDRIVILTPRPGRIERNIDITLPRPRDRNSPEFLRLRGAILEHLHFAGQSGETTSLPPSRREEATLPKRSAGVLARSTADSGTTVESLATTGTLNVAAGEDARAPQKSARSSHLDATVIIIGGGPAGSTLGSYLARAGIDHIILDQAIHPRPHVGESLVCSTTRVFQDIDFLSVMERERFVRKHGAVWTHWSDPGECVIRFREIPELGLTQDYTYHVDRSRFDQLLLQHAARLGSRVTEGARVERVEFGDTFRTVHVKTSGQSQPLRCKLVVDASGRSTVLGSQLRLKHHDALFDQFAVHNWFEGVDRGAPEVADYIHIHVLSMPRAWIWIIPINEKITSVGIVTKTADFPKSSEPLDQFFARHISSHPTLARRLANARAVHHFTREGNYSYVMERFSGDGWLLVGDAARFVDPVFSSGVSVAMESAKRAADAIIAGLRKDDVSASAFTQYETAIRAGVDIWREFILMYYQLPALFFDLISKPGSRSQITRILQGDVYDRASIPVLAEMRQVIQSVAADPAHPWRSQLSPELLLTRP
jgi:ABC-type nitrate/sulfonate/bicarbonate transport system ATPase subunit/flavin-dependent dehydrogenase